MSIYSNYLVFFIKTNICNINNACKSRHNVISISCLQHVIYAVACLSVILVVAIAYGNTVSVKQTFGKVSAIVGIGAEYSVCAYPCGQGPAKRIISKAVIRSAWRGNSRKLLKSVICI